MQDNILKYELYDNHQLMFTWCQLNSDFSAVAIVTTRGNILEKTNADGETIITLRC